jgi:glycosyltransferase involved in cell wall biosynthesis
MPHLVLDLSRLITNADRPAPTGIDRVELAYARELLRRPDDTASFVAMTDWLRFGPLDRARVASFVAALDEKWSRGPGTDGRAGRIAAALRRDVWLRGEAALHARLRRVEEPAIYLNVSHHHLHRPESIARLKKSTAISFVALVHDLIPIQFPEYVRPSQDEVHRRRIAALGVLADGIITNSEATAAFLAAALDGDGRDPPIAVAPLGIDLARTVPTGVAHAVPEPYFVCIGTIEPRKNHLLLLSVWRQIATQKGESTPHLVLIGRRGWENEMVVDLLERCPGLAGKIHELDELSDAAVGGLVADARALLMPSFAEGYGLPILEAIALGAPVLCSDIPVFREVGGGGPEYLDPLDGPAWRRAILDYADNPSPRRTAQLARLRGRAIPTWEQHFALVEVFLSGLKPL